MPTGNILSPTAGWAAIATGVFVILAVISIILMATVNGIFGPVNDFFNALIGLSSLVLAFFLISRYGSHWPLLAQISFAFALAGAVFVVAGSVLVMFKYTGYVLASWYTGIGNAMIGLWLALFCYTLLPDEAMPNKLVISGITTGGFMAIGLFGIPAVFHKIDTMESLSWYLYVAYFSWVGTYILYPVWTIRIGRNLLSQIK